MAMGQAPQVTIEVTCVTVDCADPVVLVAFWAEALGWDIVRSGTSGALCRPAGGGLGLEFIRVPEPKTVKNRVHVGTRAVDFDAEISRLESLGASFAWVAVQAMVQPAIDDASLVLPFGQLAIVVAVAGVAGLLAGVLPARRAARTAPAAGLALE